MTSMMPPWMIGTPRYLEKASDFTTEISKRVPNEGNKTKITNEERQLWKEFKAEMGDKKQSMKALVDMALKRMDNDGNSMLARKLKDQVANFDDKLRTFREQAPDEHNDDYKFSNDEIDGLMGLIKGMFETKGVIEDMLEGVYYKGMEGVPKPYQLAKAMIYDANRWENEPVYIMPAGPAVAPPPGIMPPRFERFNFNREETTSLVAQLNLMDNFGYSVEDQKQVVKDLYYNATARFGKIRILDREAAQPLTQAAHMLGLRDLDFAKALNPPPPPPEPIEPIVVMYGIIDDGNPVDIRAMRDHLISVRNAIEPQENAPIGGGLTQPMSMVMASLGEGARTPADLDVMIKACNDSLGE